MSRPDQTRQTPRADAAGSMAKCLEFADASHSALADHRWDAAGLAAIHSGICAGDAALIASAGLRSASEDHGAVVALLDDQVPEFAAAQRRQLGGLLKMKNRVAYEQRLLTETEARQLADQARRLANWARRVVDAHMKG